MGPLFQIPQFNTMLPFITTEEMDMLSYFTIYEFCRTQHVLFLSK